MDCCLGAGLTGVVGDGTCVIDIEHSLTRVSDRATMGHLKHQALLLMNRCAYGENEGGVVTGLGEVSGSKILSLTDGEICVSFVRVKLT